MSSGASDESVSLTDRLVTACYHGDLRDAVAAVADGASVNEEGTTPDCHMFFPLAAAVYKRHHDVVVWLLSRGADRNGDGVICYGAYDSATAILQLVIDAGGDVNRTLLGVPSLLWAVRGDNSEDNVRVLLAQPSLDLTVAYGGKTPEQSARDNGRGVVADMIAQEVGARDPCFFSVPSEFTLALLWLTGRETSDAGTATVFWFDHTCVVTRA